MRLKYRLLGQKRHTVRSIARDALLRNPNDANKAIEEATREIRTGSIISSFLIALAIKLAVELIWYWVKKRFFVPPVVYTQDEPGY